MARAGKIKGNPRFVRQKIANPGGRERPTPQPIPGERRPGIQVRRSPFGFRPSGFRLSVESDGGAGRSGAAALMPLGPRSPA